MRHDFVYSLLYIHPFCRSLALLSSITCIVREKLKKKLEESGGLTFQIPQFNTEYGTRRVPAVKKIKVLKEGKVLKIKVAKDKKEKEKGLRKKLTSKMVQDSLDLLLNGSGVLSPQGMERVAAPRSPGKLRGSAFAAAIKKGAVEKVKQAIDTNTPYR